MFLSTLYTVFTHSEKLVAPFKVMKNQLFLLPAQTRLSGDMHIIYLTDTHIIIAWGGDASKKRETKVVRVTSFVYP